MLGALGKLGIIGKISKRSNEFSWLSYWATRTPSGLTVVALTDTSVKVDWTANGVEDYDGYSIERSLDGITYAEVDTVAVGTETFTDTVTADTLYYYRVRACRGTNYSDYTDVAVLEYGPEMVVDSSFDDTSKWVKSAGVVVDSGKATLTITSGGNQYVYQEELVINTGVTYRIKLDTTLISGTGQLTLCWGAGNNMANIPAGWSTNVDFDYTSAEYRSSIGIKRLTSTGNYVFQIDNFSVKKKF